MYTTFPQTLKTMKKLNPWSEADLGGVRSQKQSGNNSCPPPLCWSAGLLWEVTSAQVMLGLKGRPIPLRRGMPAGCSEKQLQSHFVGEVRSDMGTPAGCWQSHLLGEQVALWSRARPWRGSNTCWGCAPLEVCPWALTPSPQDYPAHGLKRLHKEGARWG